MRRITQKLHSSRGASLIYALMLFLVASMVSILILNASVTAAKRLADDREREQEYLALSSAARLIKKCIEDSSVVITESETVLAGSRDYTGPDYSSVGPLGETLNACVQALNGPTPAGGTLYEVLYNPDYTGTAESTELFEVEVTTGESERFPNAKTAASPKPLMYLKKTVEGEIKRYYISAALTLVNGETEGEQTIYLTADATLTPSRTSQKGDPVKTGEGDSDMIWPVITDYTTTITWTNVNLSTIPPKE